MIIIIIKEQLSPKLVIIVVENSLRQYMPIIGMGFLFTIGIVIALFLSPIFLQMNARADFSELGDVDENSLWIIVIYMVSILIFTAIILILGKTRKGKFLKYVIIGVVGITIIYTLMPIIGYAMHGPLQLIWDTNDDIDSRTTFITVYDIDDDNDAEVIVGTTKGTIHILDPESQKEEWKSQSLDSAIRMILVRNLESDGDHELVVKTDDQLAIYSYRSNSDYKRIYLDNSGEVSAVATGDHDNDGVLEIYTGTRLGVLKMLTITQTSSSNPQVDIRELRNDINRTVTSLIVRSPLSDDTDYQDTIIIAGTEDGTGLFYASNGTIWNEAALNDLRGIRYPVFMELEVIDPSTFEAGTGTTSSQPGEGVLVILSLNKVLSFFRADSLEKIGSVSGINEFGSLAVLDVLDNRDGKELVLKSGDELEILYSKDSLWDSSVDASTFIYDFDPEGNGAAATDLDDDGKKEVILGASSGFMYGELEAIEFSNVPCITALIIAFVLLMLLLNYPEWYIVDIIGIIIGAGVCAIIGISIAVLPILAFLIVLAIYDAISVYKTKHMIDLADNVMSMRLPIVLVIPKKLSYSYLDQERLKDQLDSKKEREAMFMGLGDVIIPGALVVSSFTFLPASASLGALDGNLFVALGTLVGALVGFALLMRFVLKGNPQAGLPLLNSGAIIGYLVSYVIAFQEFSFGLTGIF